MKKILIGIRSRLIFWMLILGLVPLLTNMLIFLGQQVTTIREENIDHLESIRDLKVHDMEDWLNEKLGDIHVISEDVEIRQLENIINKTEYNSTENQKITAARDLFLNNQQHYPDFYEFALLDAETGIVKISTNSDAEGKNLSSQRFFSEAIEKEDVFFDGITLNQETKKPEFLISMPVFCLSHNHHIIGVLLARIDPEVNLYPLLEERKGMGLTGETLIIDEDGYALNSLRGDADAALRLRIHAAPAMEAIAGNTGTIVAEDYKDEKVLAAYTYIPRLNWGFVSKQNTSEVFRPIRVMVRNFLIIVLFSIAVVLFVGIYLSDTITRPLVNLTRISKRIASGEEFGTIPEEGPEEIRELTRDLVSMTGTLNRKLQVKADTGRISAAVMEGSGMEEITGRLLEELRKISDCNILVYYNLNLRNREFYAISAIGFNKELSRPVSLDYPDGEFDHVLQEKKIRYLKDAGSDSPFKYATVSGELLCRELITIPVLNDSHVTGIIALGHVNGFPEHFMEALEDSWPVISASISRQIVSENLLETTNELQDAFNKLEIQSEELQEQTEELEEQAGEMEKQNKELERKNREVMEANRLKSEFLSNVSHELRTPLNSILSLSRVLGAKSPAKFGTKEKSYIEVIERNGRNLLQLINDILDLSKIEAGRLHISIEEVSINRLINTILETLSTLASEKGLLLKTRIQEGLPEIETDPARVRQILTNIIHNAIKFTEKGSVEIQAEQEDKQVIIRISDTGIGMNSEELDLIFSQFVQGDGSVTRKYEGTGLGLSIAKQLTELLHGKVYAESTQGEGSVFTVQLPVKWEGSRNALRKRQQRDVGAEPDAYSGRKIMVIEDNQDAADQLRIVLEAEGFVVFVSQGGAGSVSMVKEEQPDLILLDLMMPEIDGFTLLEIIKKDKEISAIPVLVLTAKDLTKKDLDRLEANNVHMHIQKGDIDIGGLMDNIRQQLVHADLKKMREAKRRKVPAKVLIVEDNPDNRITIRAILDDDFVIVEAEDGTNLKGLIEEYHPSLVLMDIHLPGKDGITLAKELRADERFSEMPVIAITAKTLKENEKQQIDELFDGFLPKPLNPDQLLKQIYTYI